MRVVLLHRSVPVLIIIKVGARKVPTAYPNKCNVYREHFLKETMRWRPGRLLSLIRLKTF